MARGSNVTAVVLWHSKMLESDDFVTAEMFDYDRFRRFMNHAQGLLQKFLKFKLLAEDAVEQLKGSGAMPPT
jgi:hypothetical protein